MRLHSMRIPALLCAPLLALGLSACAQTVSTAGLSGEAKAVAETVKDLQGNATTGEAKKICQNDLASPVVKRLAGSGGGCQEVIKKQLTEVASVELTVESVQVAGATATAHVKSVYSGKKKVTSIALVREGRRWKIAAFG